MTGKIWRESGIQANARRWEVTLAVLFVLVARSPEAHGECASTADEGENDRRIFRRVDATALRVDRDS
jgi:hypothetical protein